METEQLSRTEKSLYCAQLMQWAVLSTHENLHIFCEYAAHIDQLDLRVYVNGWNSNAFNDPKWVKIDLKMLTKEKIAEIQTEIKNILDHADLPK